jgi:hypothetical protein
MAGNDPSRTLTFDYVSAVRKTPQIDHATEIVFCGTSFGDTFEYAKASLDMANTSIDVARMNCLIIAWSP